MIGLAEINLLLGLLLSEATEIARVLYFPLKRVCTAYDARPGVRRDANIGVKGRGLPRGNDMCTCTSLVSTVRDISMI